MKRAHSASKASRVGVARDVARAAAALGLANRAVAVACSGGVDSVVLATVLCELAPRRGLRVSLAHVNHGLRGAESDADEAFVRALAARLGVPFASRRVDVLARIREARSSRARPTLQEAARRLRADALRMLAAELGAECVATAHTADDQAETVLLRLLRGCGPEALGGIAERTADRAVVRPLLRVSRADVLADARRRGLAWREDPSNADPGYARARLRHEWLPGLARAFNPALLRAIGDLAEAQRRESECFAAWLEQEMQRRFAWDADGSLRIEAGGWDSDATPDALARRLARAAMQRMGAGRDVTRAHVERIVRFWRSGRLGSAIELPGGLRLARDARGFSLARNLPFCIGC